ncbi:hypothetical protein [Pseudoxanthomonas winnipegensis]|uniref:Uncharacterized protein n=1 Tax=Pseudoxanthomonas winnipegensis TaxID=2480810 RepID=A0A4Q8LK97_9GAMM|nr:hypothetical protein [Pseudoxanthomonas winnipegensis]RZZ85170.1 hypothetical protein EA662_12110 [Pseudoxanthomonas winnipegensis]TAA30915.1 hypothetical protein EA661_04765 [Pseudoxanthomonas winnipegensis]TAA38730.1 hypothetical protein EAT51_17355 [Pseudoxanthomonas winnipegensis]TBV77762.1 hypothetical protein EYC46_05625 [Pseudoxanthomonas winnipegensis]
MAKRRQMTGWRARWGLARGSDVAAFWMAIAVVGTLMVLGILGVRTTGALQAAALACFAASLWIERPLDRRRGLLNKRLGQIHEAFAQGLVPRMPLASRLLSITGAGLLLIAVVRAIEG